MKRFLVRRVVLAFFTLAMLSLVVFVATHLLPGDVGKSILGPFADRDAVKLLNHQLGTDRSIPAQYLTWVGNFLHGDLGQSFKYDVPVSEKLRPALGYSARLAVLAFVMVVWRRAAGGFHYAPGRTEGRLGLGFGVNAVAKDAVLAFEILRF